MGEMADLESVMDGDVAANLGLWTRAKAECTDEHAYRAWAGGEITWGVFTVPDRQLGVIGAFPAWTSSSSDAAAYCSAWLARRGARPVGVDVSPRPARHSPQVPEPFLESRSRSSSPTPRNVPLPGDSFDLAISQCGASLWCELARWVPEAARLLRPCGRLVFHTTSILVTLCLPETPGPALESCYPFPRMNMRRHRS
jgi:SAM-dependent methyltransferase